MRRIRSLIYLPIVLLQNENSIPLKTVSHNEFRIINPYLHSTTMKAIIHNNRSFPTTATSRFLLDRANEARRYRASKFGNHINKNNENDKTFCIGDTALYAISKHLYYPRHCKHLKYGVVVGKSNFFLYILPDDKSTHLKRSFRTVKKVRLGQKL